jgi:hypothetical protein
VGFWGPRCQFAVGVVVGGRNGCVVEMVDEEFEYAAAVVVGEGFDRAELRTFAPADGECRECIASLRASLGLY